MLEYSYHKEQSDLLMLFTSAFDDAFVNRFDFNSNTPVSRVDVRYVHGPKQRVIQDIVSKDKSLTLPVVTIEQTGLARDASRVMHKNQIIYRPLVNNNNAQARIPTPIPVTMDVKVSILAKYKEDIDQISQNFATQCNPYIVVSWKIPTVFGLNYIDEVRVQIEWSGSISYSTPSTLSKDDKYRISGDTTFTIKGWLFPPSTTPQGTIYRVDSNFISADLRSRTLSYDSYRSLSANNPQRETVSVSAQPVFTNVYFTKSASAVLLDETTTLKKSLENGFLLLGKRFDYSNVWYLSANVPNFYTGYSVVSTATSPLISAYKLPASSVVVTSDNIANITLSANQLSATGLFTIITSNSAGWAATPIAFAISNA